MKVLVIPLAILEIGICGFATPVFADESLGRGEPIYRQETVMSSTNELEQRGKKLRADIDNAYKKLSEASGIKDRGMGSSPITDVVTKYIPIGISFDDAETILRSAGFAIRPRAPNPYISEKYPEKYDVVATIDQYVPTPFGKTSVIVSLRPRNPGDYSVVRKVSAEITRIYL